MLQQIMKPLQLREFLAIDTGYGLGRAVGELKVEVLSIATNAPSTITAINRTAIMIM